MIATLKTDWLAQLQCRILLKGGVHVAFHVHWNRNLRLAQLLMNFLGVDAFGMQRAVEHRPWNRTLGSSALSSTVVVSGCLFRGLEGVPLEVVETSALVLPVFA